MKQPSEVAEEIERLSAEIHKCYCRAYERRFGKPYWTNGDYSKLDEATKDYDREMARFVMARDKENEERVKLCGICGGRMFFIRGRYPKQEKREVCPTCAVEKLEQIREISDPDYGRAYTDSPSEKG